MQNKNNYSKVRQLVREFYKLKFMDPDDKDAIIEAATNCIEYMAGYCTHITKQEVVTNAELEEILNKTR